MGLKLSRKYSAEGKRALVQYEEHGEQKFFIAEFETEKQAQLYAKGRQHW